MPDAHDVHAAIESAEQAAAAHDYASAERFLRDAARMQEASLGPLHPDLANTLNNLAVVCEIAQKPVDAEQWYRRAHAIARAALAPDHPFVATSGQNLRDFCAARGIPVESPAVRAELPQLSSGAEASSEPRPRAAGDVRRAREVTGSTSPAAPRWSRAAIVTAAGALAIGVALAARPWFDQGASVASPAGDAARPDPVVSTSTPDPPRVPPAPPSRAMAADAGDRVEPQKSPPLAQSAGDRVEPPRPEAIAPAMVSVIDAQLCRALARGGPGGWRCDPASDPIGPGPLFFYTRVKAASDTTVEHRWYRGDRLHRAVELRVGENREAGYRTYSRNTLNAASAGDWRIEVRSDDGALLRELRFTAR